MPSALPLALLLALASAEGGAAQASPAATPVGEPAKPPDRAPTAAPGRTSTRATVLEEVSGVALEVDRKDHRVVLETASGRITVALDRNTMVYTEAGLGTVLDVKPGHRLRVGRNSDSLAYWVQVRPQEPRPGPAGERGATGQAAPGASPDR